MAAIHLTCTDTDDIRSYCTSLDKVMDVNNIITFMIGIDPSFCYSVSKHVMDIANKDPVVQEYRRRVNNKHDDKIEDLYLAQCRWYKEATHCQTLTGDKFLPPSLHVSDVFLTYDSDVDTVRLTEEVLYRNLDNIVSMMLYIVAHPLQRILQYLPQCSRLSALYISHMRNKENNDQLLSVIPHLTQLDNILYYGAALITAADTDDDVEDILPVYDKADMKAVKAILQLTQLKRIGLGWVDLADSRVESTRDMRKLQEVQLSYFSMSARSWDMFLSCLLTLQQPVHVGLQRTNIDDVMVRRILTSPHFRVIYDDGERDVKGWYEWLKC